MDSIFDFIVDFFLELFIWERMNDYLRKMIPNRPLRWIATTLIYLLIFAAFLAVLAGICFLITTWI